MSRTPEQGPQLHKITLVCYDKDDWDNMDTDSILAKATNGFDEWLGKGTDVRCIAVYPTYRMDIETAEEVADIFGDSL
jgi:hypothetical protein